MEKVEDKKNQTRGFGYFVTFIVFVFLLATFIVNTFGVSVKEQNIEKIKSAYTLIETSEKIDNGSIKKIANQDTVDYFIKAYNTAIENMVYVKSFILTYDDKYILKDISENHNDRTIKGTYAFIDNQWYIYNESKKHILKEEALSEINTIVENANRVLDVQKAINNSWEKK